MLQNNNMGRTLNQRANHSRSTVLLLAAATLSLHGGCATITEGSSQTIFIETDPAGARCELTRDGQLISRLHDTPATISIHKESGDLQLSCGKQGYLDTTLSTASDFQDMVLGNILFGGLIGVAIDMGSGATAKYPDRISITLVPAVFPSKQAREDYFEATRQRLLEEAAARIAKIRQDCENDACQRQVDAVIASRDRQLARLASQKRDTRIQP